MDEARATQSNSRYRSGAIEIDAMHRSVLIDGTPAKIGARAFDVLLALVERRERVVPKRELMDLVWPKLVVEEGNLLVHMVALRKLLGSRAIATIPGRGYRFVMPVDVIESGGAAESARPSVTIGGNVPASSPLFGRAEDLEAVEALLREHPVVTIVGAGGIGKTRIALAAAAAPRVESPHGCWWVELASLIEGGQVPSSIAGSLGLQLPPGSPKEALATTLAAKSLLLVLDNCEHLADDIAPLIDILRVRAPNVRLLVTSQESLKCREEQVYRLGPLAVPANAQLEEAAEFGAVALFVERAHAVDSRFRLAAENVEIVVDICRRLDGIPLAIELAAARVPMLGVHGLHARLDQMFNVLTGGTRMKLRRHQTLRAAIEWSYGLLSADEQTAFRRLGVFTGGFTLELAQEIVKDERIDQWLVLDLLGHLIDKSLVIADGEAEPELRYRLLDTTRAFALERLAVAGESEAMLRCHAQVICELMTAIDANFWNLSAAEHCKHSGAVHELGNLRAALDWVLASEDDRTLAYELLGRCWPVWMLNGLTGEGVQRMLQLWPPPPNLPAKIEADFCLAFARLNKDAGREEHWQAARRATALYRKLDDADRLGHALLVVATIGALRHQMSEAEHALREAEKLVTASAALRKQAALAATQGQCYLRRGAAELAIAAFRRQVELYRCAGDMLGENAAIGNVGSAQLDAGDLDSAIESLRKSVDGLRRINAPYGVEFRLGTLALALAWRGDDVDILPLAREAFDHHRLLGVTFAPLMAAALQHARGDNARRAVLLAGYACSKPSLREPTSLIALPIRQRVRDRAAAQHPSAAVQTWLHAGECLTEEQAAAIAFDDAPLEGLHE